MTQARATLASTLAVLLAAACGGQSDAPSESKTGTAQAQTAPEPAPAASGERGVKAAQPVLSAYEAIREKLAADQVDAIASDAQKLQKSAAALAKSAPESWRAPSRLLADAAEKLHAMPKKDADDVRRAFGETSRHLVALLAAAPELRKGLHLFQCPMAQGYKKWVQPSAELENPYMGKRMLRCGGKSEW